jgi:hypothetical protein
MTFAVAPPEFREIIAGRSSLEALFAARMHLDATAKGNCEMMRLSNGLPVGRRAGQCAGALAICVGLGAEAGERVQGLFCNSEGQIDAALSSLGAGLDPLAAVDLLNSEQVVCTYVDQLEYEIEDPVNIGTSRSLVPLVKYRGQLTGVIVGDALRPVSPPVEVHFVTPEPPARAVSERRT